MCCCEKTLGASWIDVCELERSLSWTACRLANLSNGSEMVGEVRDTRDHSGELDVRHLAG